MAVLTVRKSVSVNSILVRLQLVSLLKVIVGLKEGLHLIRYWQSVDFANNRLNVPHSGEHMHPKTYLCVHTYARTDIKWSYGLSIRQKVTILLLLQSIQMKINSIKTLQIHSDVCLLS